MAAVSSQAKVGLFVLIAAFVLVYMTIRVQKMDVEKGGYRIIAFFDTVSGLERASNVKVAGVDAGKVELIELVKGRAKITMYIYPEVALHTDSVGRVRSMGLLGEKFVEITSGSDEKERLKDGSVLAQIQESTDFDQLTSSINDIASDIKEVSHSMRIALGGEKGQQSLQKILSNTETLSGDLKSVIQENREQLKQIMLNMNRLSANLDQVVTQNRQSVNESVKRLSEISNNINEIVKNNRAQIERTITQLESISRTLDKESPQLAENAKKTMKDVQEILAENREGLKESMDKLRKASDNINKTAESTSVITKKIEKGEGTLGKLFTNDEAYNNLNDGLKGLKSFIEKGKDLQIFVGVRTEFLTPDDEAKTYISLSLQPRDDKFYLFEVVDDPRGKTSTKTTKKTSNSGSVETTKEEVTEDRMKFSVQMAKKFYDLTLRGGLIESTGGVGLDYEPWGENKVKFRMEAWDLGGDTPHLKFTTNFYVYDQAFVNVGADDFINAEHTNFFVGVGLLFSDQDLKSLLGGIAYGSGTLTQ